MVMIFVCAQPATVYYAWQLDTMLCNFVRHGVDAHEVHVVLMNTDQCTNGQNPIFERLAGKYPPNVRFFYYDDTRPSRKYIPSLRPHVLAKHFRRHAASFREASGVFYHDCDIVFTRHVSDFLEPLAARKPVWCMSDTTSYVGYEYIVRQGGEALYRSMCAAAGVDEHVPRERPTAGGAQYLMHDVDAGFWEEVEEACVALYDVMDASGTGIQKWTADMWAVLWIAWKRGVPTDVRDELAFSWPGDDIRLWHARAIFHNAGVAPAERARLFLKTDFAHDLPYHGIGQLVHKYDATKCAFMYVMEILRARNYRGASIDPREPPPRASRGAPPPPPPTSS